MKKSVLALWIAISVTAVSLIGIWGFAWYYFIYQGNGRITKAGASESGSGERERNSPAEQDEKRGEFAGTVKDMDTGEPIFGASVQWQFEGHASSVFTNQDGTFTVSGLEPGEYRILVSMNGYQDSSEMGAVIEEGISTILLDDILLKKELNYYQFIREQLLPAMGYADTQTNTALITNESYASNFAWDKRKGLLSADIADFNRDGTEDLLVAYFADSTENYWDNRISPALYLSLYTKNESSIYLINTLEITNFPGINFQLLQAGIMEVNGIPFLYVEENTDAYFADGYDVMYTWYGYDGAALRPFWQVGKTDGGTSGIAYSLLTYSDAETYTKQVIWADWDYRGMYPEVALACTDNIQDIEALTIGFQLMGLPAPVALSGEAAAYSKLYPTYWSTEHLKNSFQYTCYGEGSYMSRNMRVSVSDHTKLQEKVTEQEP